MSKIEIKHYEDVEVDYLKQSFSEWIDKFLEQFRKTLVTEMTDPQTRGYVVETETSPFLHEEDEKGESLKFSFITEFNFSIKKVNNKDSEKESGQESEELNVEPF